MVVGPWNSEGLRIDAIRRDLALLFGTNHCWNTETNETVVRVNQLQGEVRAMIDSGTKSSSLDAARWEARREINLRIIIQNTILMLYVVMVSTLILLAGTGLVTGWVAWFASLFASFTLGQIWLHSGIRHAQYRMFFMSNLDLVTPVDFLPWESFLKKVRPNAILGAHWYISTKAVFGTSHLAVIVATGIEMGRESLVHPDFWVLCAAGGVSSFILLYLLMHPRLPDLGADLMEERAG